MSVARFWREQPARYNMYGDKCEGCKEVFFPPRDVCPECKGTALNKFKLSGKGKILTYTVIHVAPEGFEKEVPYVIAIVELDEGPKLTTPIVDCEPEDVKTGLKVESIFRKITEDGSKGAIYYGTKFRLADK